MADILILIRADYRHILCWQAVLGELRRLHRPGSQGCGRVLATGWYLLASLIDWHMSAEEEICGPVLSGSGPRGRRQVMNLLADHKDTLEVIRETGQQPPGTPRWWQLAELSLSAWARQADLEEHDFLAAFHTCTTPAQRNRLGRQWIAFMNAQVRDQFPRAAPDVPACHLRRAQILATMPQFARLSFGPIFCTCPACARKLNRILPVLPASTGPWPGKTSTGGGAHPAAVAAAPWAGPGR